jgi:2,3-bisphosphoglycerate-independent phosphoglycerate mutase
MSTQPKVLTFILDGWGINKPYPGNAIHLAKTPYFDQLWQNQPHAELECSGLAVGLPEGQMGTSEVNHMVIGAGKVIYQDLAKIDKAIKDADFFDNPQFLKAFNHVKKHNSKLHIMGLYGPGGVHSHSNHVKALVQAAKKHGLKDEVFLQMITDGRDTKPKSGLGYIEDLEEFLSTEGVGKIASLSGRYYAMDRDHNWERTDKYFEMVTQGKTEHQFSTASEAIQANYDQDTTDEFIEPALITEENQQPTLIQENDAVIFVNFRSDRPRQLTERILEKGPKNLLFVTMAQYNPDYQVEVAYPPEVVNETLGGAISKAGLKQLRITETEKFAHLTFFMNCKKEEPYPGEDRIMLDSNSDVKEHDEKPEMRTPDIAERLKTEIASEKYQAIFVNFCNADMVGHTGNIPATIKGIEAVDRALSELVPLAQQHGYDVIITADHGNAEQMLDEEEGDTVTAHTSYPVPFILVSSRYSKLNKDKAGMVNVAPTVLRLLEIEQPKEMTGESLV